MQETPEMVVDSILSSATHAVNATVHRTLKTTPGGLVFRWDMLLNIPIYADLSDINARRQQIIDQRTIEANNKRINWDYQPNDKVLVIAHAPGKLEPRARGPYSIVRTHVNGTVTIRRSATVTERINIRRIKPYKQ